MSRRPAHFTPNMDRQAPAVLAAGLHDAAPGTETHLPDGTHIQKHTNGFSVHNRNGRELSFHRGDTHEHAKNAARIALDMSARSHHEDSIGGSTHYNSYEHAALKHAGDTGAAAYLEPPNEGFDDVFSGNTSSGATNAVIL